MLFLYAVPCGLRDSLCIEYDRIGRLAGRLLQEAVPGKLVYGECPRNRREDARDLLYSRVRRVFTETPRLRPICLMEIFSFDNSWGTWSGEPPDMLVSIPTGSHGELGEFLWRTLASQKIAVLLVRGRGNHELVEGARARGHYGFRLEFNEKLTLPQLRSLTRSVARVLRIWRALC